MNETKNLAIAIILSIFVILLWDFYNGKPLEETTQNTSRRI